MKDKLLLLMKNEGLKPGQLAEMLEINPAGVSHILAGRNKPSFELLQKILRRFPRINPDWLLLDAPNIYREDEHAIAASSATAPSGEELFGTTAATMPTAGVVPAASASAEISASSTAPTATLAGATSSASVARIVIFRTDGTFESFIPAK